MSRLCLTVAGLALALWIAGCGETAPPPQAPAKPGPRPADTRSSPDGDAKSAKMGKADAEGDDEMVKDADDSADAPADDDADEAKDGE